MQAVSRIARSSVNERGVGLIEVLIALVVFALGVVGMAGLQLRTLSVTMDSSQRTVVVAKTQDLADRIRSNGIPAAHYLGVYSSGLSANPDATNNFCDTTPTSCSDNAATNATVCTVAQMVLFDLFDTFCVGTDNSLENNGSLESNVADWEVNISCEYPNASGVMTGTTSCNELAATVDITTVWFGRSSIGTATAAPATAPATAVTDQNESMTLRFVR